MKILIKYKKTKDKLAEIDIPANMMPYKKWSEHVSDYKFLGKILEHFADSLLKRGIDMRGAKRLNSGAYGTAYLLKDGHILKLTHDSQEASTSNYLIGKDTKHISKIIDVFKFPTARGIYGILQERLYELPKSQNDILDKAIKNIKFIANGPGAVEYNDSYVLSRPWDEIKSLVEDTLSKEYDLKKDAKLIAEARNNLLYLEKLGFGNISDDLFKNNVKYLDFHAKNIMKRADGTLVLIDLGGDSTSPGNESEIDNL